MWAFGCFYGSRGSVMGGVIEIRSPLYSEIADDGGRCAKVPVCV